jgi:hypothetical protein
MVLAPDLLLDAVGVILAATSSTFTLILELAHAQTSYTACFQLDKCTTASI